MNPINPAQMKKVAAFVESINRVCKEFDMDFEISMSQGARINAGPTGEPTPFLLVVTDDKENYSVAVSE